MSTYVVASGGNSNPNYVDQSVPESVRYNPDRGLDIDGEIIGSTPQGDLYDYDLMSRPGVGVSGSGIIIPPEMDGGFPSVDDYISNPDGSKTLKSMLSEDQNTPFDMMVDRVNNGRMGDVKEVENINVPENTDIIINKDNSDSSIKGILEENSLNSLFFSEMNVKVIQDTLRYRVYQNTDQVISEQSSNDLFIIMRSIMLQYANFRVGVDNIVDEIRRLNSKVLDYAVENVSSNVKQHQGYVDDLSKLPVPMDMPVYHNKRNFTYDISNLL
mgnify:CR=1 FL=1|tara:strand:+ start:3423 stop:4235 length:813 start_codon:yes stop_codon:yes gene_type:complete